MDNTFGDIGRELVQYSKEAEFTAQHGVVEELFPFIFQAAKRMSFRDICAYLEGKHGVKLSPMTISRALRDEAKHWKALADRIEPAARCFARAHGEAWEEVLADWYLFAYLREQPPTFTSDAIDDDFMEYYAAEHFLADRWFCFDPVVIRECMPYVSTRAAAERAKAKGKGDEKQGKRRRG